MSASRQTLTQLSHGVQSSWHEFLDAFEPLRPELYRYCRTLTYSVWDAEDLAQDTLMRAFVTLGTLFRELPNPRAWLFRVASNIWIDRMRRAQRERALDTQPGEAHPSDLRATREAAASLLERLPPQERAALVLKDVFEFSIEDIAHILSTTTGAVKSALHRARNKVVAPSVATVRAPAPAALDAFCAAFNARDLEALTALLLDSATVEIVGLVTEYGPDAPRDPETGSFAGTLSPITADERGGVAPELLDGYLGLPPRCELRAYRDEWLLVFWYEHEQGPRVRTLMRAVVAGDRLALVQNYFFSPDVIAEVCAELGLPYSVNGYRYWAVGE